jgi:excisionase family DNA binding protein
MNGEATNEDGENGLLRVSEAAAMLRVSSRTIWRMIADGQLTPVRVRRCTRLLLAEVSKYLNGGNKAGAL